MPDQHQLTPIPQNNKPWISTARSPPQSLSHLILNRVGRHTFNGKSKMQSTTNRKVALAVLVLLGFVCWLVATVVTPDSSEWLLAAWYFIIALAFFLLGIFPPDSRNRRSFLSRRSALQLMAFFIWIAVNSLGPVGLIKDNLGPPSRIVSILVPSSIVISIGSYFAAMYLIRRFRASPCYSALKKQPQTKQSTQGTQILDDKPRP